MGNIVITAPTTGHYNTLRRSSQIEMANAK